MAKSTEQELSSLRKQVRELSSKLDKILGIINADYKTDEHLISINEAARMMGMSRRSVERRIANGELPARKDGRLVRLPFSHICGLIQTREQI